ncbi:MAG: ABC transporter permease, partial [Acidobacteria bacterium]|nr:ABC transporter permease [Acidobacteriota bacterium]
MPRHPLYELTLTRFREFLREPEALFWSFLFPIIMTCALGAAFSAGSAPRIMVGVAAGPRINEIRDVLERAGNFTIRDVPAGEIHHMLRDGRAAVVIVPGTPPAYHFDAARAESLGARLAVDAALQTAAGRTD